MTPSTGATADGRTGATTRRGGERTWDGLRAAARAGRARARARWAAATAGAAERGMATAEYAIATLAAVGFAGLLLVVLRSDEVRSTLAALVRQALSV